ncbi:hypothetical protein B0T14DRAFT_567319 [Immersiella caudata]|uniref:Uncharacterized protein n=1 Tax=Immersiella caudata TaxID=314043 RepID=A0AA39WS38_9PEZI|nr:hypothetical protein B0T14DRAFT_567319 [Immersiella caudata]
MATPSLASRLSPPPPVDASGKPAVDRDESPVPVLVGSSVVAFDSGVEEVPVEEPLVELGAVEVRVWLRVLPPTPTNVCTEAALPMVAPGNEKTASAVWQHRVFSDIDSQQYAAGSAYPSPTHSQTCTPPARKSYAEHVRGETALSSAARNIVGILIDARTSTDGINGTIALKSVVEGNFIDIAKLLLAKAVSPNRPLAQRGRGSSAVRLAVERQASSDDMVRLLLIHRADLQADGSRCLQIAAEKGSLQTVQILVAAGADVNSPALGTNEKAAPQGAIMSKNTDIVYTLLGARADINTSPSPRWGMAALQAAMSTGH